MMTLRGAAPAAAAAASAASTAASAALICDGRGDKSMGNKVHLYYYILIYYSPTTIILFLYIILLQLRNKGPTFCYGLGNRFCILSLPGMIQSSPTGRRLAG